MDPVLNKLTEKKIRILLLVFIALVRELLDRTVCVCVYRVSQEICARLREGVPYVKIYRYNPKHLYPKLNGYGDKGARKV